jgi:hypothetical protein
MNSRWKGQKNGQNQARKRRKESGYNIKATLYVAFYVNAIFPSLLAACEILSCQQDYLVW